MATVTGYTAARMKQIEDKAITSGSVVDGELFLYPNNYPSEIAINAGSVVGPEGPEGPPGGVTTGQMNTAIAAQVGPLQTPTSCKVIRTTAISAPHNTYTTILFDEVATSESWDTGSMHSPTVNPSRLTVPTNGVYQCSVNITFAPGSSVSGTRLVQIRKNGNVVEQIQQDYGTVLTNVHISSTISFYLTAGQYLDLVVYHFTGVSNNVSGSFSLHRMSN